MNNNYFSRVLILLCLILLVKCGSSNQDVKEEAGTGSVDSASNKLAIIQDSTPFYKEPDGKFSIASINSGTVLKIISKGNFGSFDNNQDYWYYVDYKDTKGWIFGSYTSLRLKNEFELFLQLFNNPLKDTISASFSKKFLDGRRGYIPLEYKRLDDSRFAALFYKKTFYDQAEIILFIYQYGLPVKSAVLFNENISGCIPPQVFFTSKDFIKLIGQSCKHQVKSVSYFQILENNSLKELKSTITAKTTEEILPKIKAELKVINKSFSDECKCIVQTSVKEAYKTKDFIFYSLTRDECKDYCITTNSSLIAMQDSIEWSIRFEEKGVFKEIFESGLPNQYIVVLEETRRVHLFERTEIKRLFLFDLLKKTMQELNLKSESCVIVSPEQFGCKFCSKSTTHTEEMVFFGNPVKQAVKKIKNIIYDSEDGCKVIDQNNSSVTYEWVPSKKMFVETINPNP
ncbi:MAG: hypothetical protein U0W24_23900 [Bacteroidales bacterium]